MIVSKRELAGGAARAILIAVALSLATTEAAPAQLRTRVPEPGDFLIASRRLDDANFAEAVVLLLAYGPDGAQGIIVNRRTLVRIATALPGIEELAARPDTIFWGGPVEPNQAVLLARGAEPPPNATPLLEDVWLVRTRAGIEHLLARGAPASQIRLYGGYAGWGPGQLDFEIETGSWYLRRGEADRIFAEDTDALWKSLSLLASAPVV